MAQTTTPDFDLVSASERLQPLIEEHAARSEAEQRLSPELVDALHEAGILKISTPWAATIAP